MTDPERILDRPRSELARRLLRAGCEEAPSPRSLQRTLSALGAGATALGAASTAGALAAAKTGGSLTLVALTKWAGLGAVGGIVVASAAHGLNTPPAPVVPARAVPVAQATPSSAPSPSAGVPAPLVQVPAEAPAPQPPVPRPSPKVAPEAELDAPLAAEVAFVDRGRAAFQRGDQQGALALLASYEREFPEPRLLPEVLYLRMEALEKRGEHALAGELARRILQRYPQSPHAARARGVLGEP